MASILEDFRKDWPKVEGFYTYDPRELRSWYLRTQYLNNYSRDNLYRILPELKLYNERLGCGPTTLANINALEEEGTLAVITGQQSGLFTGPLYTIYKAITVVQVAKKYSEILGRTVVPIFWIASEDHDWLEVNHANIVVSGRKGKTFRVKGNPNKKPVGCYYLEGEGSRILEELSEGLEESSFKEATLGMVRDKVKENTTLSQWFGQIMTLLFREEGLIFVDPLLRDFRQVQGQILLEGLSKAIHIKEAFNKATNLMRVKGYEPLIQQEDDQLPFFVIHEGKRLPLLYQNGIYGVKGTDLRWTHEDLLVYARDNRQTLSPNVALRPVIQDRIFPTLAYVGGPGELAYYAQLKEIYPFWDLEMPIIYPRSSYLIIEPSVREIIERWQLSYQDLKRCPEKLADEILSNILSWDVAREFDDLASNIESEYKKMGQNLLRNLPHLEGLLEDNLGRVLRQVRYLEKKSKQGLRRGHKDLVGDLTYARDRLYPQGLKQERYWNLVGFLALYGHEWLKELIGAPLPEVFEEELIFLLPVNSGNLS